MYDLAATLERVALMAAAAVPDTKQAFAQFFRTYPNFPYWTLRLGPMQVEPEGEPYEVHTHEVVLRLVIGHLTEGYDGALEGRLPGYVTEALAYFQARPTLQRTRADAPLLYLHPNGAAVVRASGYRAFVRLGESVQIGAEITLSVPFHATIERAV
ncbi:MAG: hypothetical protein M5R40_06570 [Anaerolineae bacterium]|nr:hypothetical protein [Anaerolineae bacterium]